MAAKVQQLAYMCESGGWSACSADLQRALRDVVDVHGEDVVLAAHVHPVLVLVHMQDAVVQGLLRHAVVVGGARGLEVCKTARSSAGPGGTSTHTSTQASSRRNLQQQKGSWLDCSDSRQHQGQTHEYLSSFSICSRRTGGGGGGGGTSLLHLLLLLLSEPQRKPLCLNKRLNKVRRSSVYNKGGAAPAPE